MAALRRLAPWLVAAAILAHLFANVSVGAAWDAARSARLELFAPALLASVTLWFWIESIAFAYLFSRFNAPLSWREARALRGMTYLLTPINWNVGTAAIVLYLRRSKQIAAVESSSSLLFYGLIDTLVLSCLALAGAARLPDAPEISALRRAAIGFMGAALVLLALFMAPAPDWGWLRRLRALGIFRSHALARPRDVLSLMGLRGVYFGVFAGVFWIGSHAFGVEVPLAVAAAATPAICMIGALPITPAGLGTQAATMLFFFSRYGDEAAILAFGLAFPVGQVLARAALGLRYLRGIADLRRAR